MTSQVQVKTAPEPGSVALGFGLARDRMMRAYNPATEEERVLVTQIAQAWLRLQRFYEFESQVFEQTGLFDLFTNDVEKYKLLTRGVADAERMWRHAVEMFERARRRTVRAQSPATHLNARDRRPAAASTSPHDAPPVAASADPPDPGRPVAAARSRPLALV